MSFYGLICKPGGTTPYVPNADGAKLHISQATLATAEKGARTVVSMKVGESEDKFIICSFRAGVNETCGLDIIVGEYAEFFVEGPSAVHLTGYMMPDMGPDDDDEDYDDDEEEEETEEDQEYLRQLLANGGRPGIMFGDDDDEEDDDDESDDDDEDDSEEEFLVNRSAFNSGVVIKEIGEDDEAEEEAPKQGQKRVAAKAPEKAPPAKKGPAAAAATPTKGAAVKEEKGAAAAAKPATPGAKGGVKAETPAKPAAAAAAAAEGKKTPVKSEQKTPVKSEQKPAPAAAPVPAPAAKAGSQFTEGTPGGVGTRKFDNGLEIRNTKMGHASGKVAIMGKRVQMKYVGRLASNGKVFDSSKGSPFTFRLGVGEVIKGWDIGVKGMRVGDRRTLVIPSELAYGKRGVPGTIPPNATLEFDIELVNCLEK